MSRYRKIDCRMWGDSKVRKLSNNTKLLWCYLLSCPESTSLPGLIVIGRLALAEALNWQPDTLDDAFGELVSVCLAKADWEARVVFLLNAWKYANPESANVVKSWRNHWDVVPECPLKYEGLSALRQSRDNLKSHLTDSFDMAFGKLFENLACPENQNQHSSQTGAQDVVRSLETSQTRSKPSKPTVYKASEEFENNDSAKKQSVTENTQTPPKPCRPPVLGSANSFAYQEQEQEQRNKNVGFDPNPTRPSPLKLELVPATPSSHTPEREVYEHYLVGWRLHVRGKRQPILDTKRLRCIRARLAESFSVQDLRRACDGLWQSSWHIENHQIDLALVCRDASHVEKFLSLAPTDTAAPASPPTVQDEPLETDEEILARTKETERKLAEIRQKKRSRTRPETKTENEPFPQGPTNQELNRTPNNPNADTWWGQGDLLVGEG